MADSKKTGSGRPRKRRPVLSATASLLLPSNMLTFSRLLAVPLILALWLIDIPGGRLAATLVFILAGLTDLFDGLLARSRNEVTYMGAFLDPVADKVLVVATLLLVVQHFSTPQALLLVPAVIIVAREIAISALRELAARLQHLDDLKIIGAAKGKTVLQMVAVGGLMLAGSEHMLLKEIIFAIATFFLYLSAALSLWTLGVYVFKARRWLASHSGDDG